MKVLTQPINQEAATLASKLLNHEFVVAEYKDQHGQTQLFLECQAINLSISIEDEQWIANTMSGDPIYGSNTLEGLIEKCATDSHWK